MPRRPPSRPRARRDPLDAAEAALRSQGLAYPEVTEEFPWGHRALKVRGRAFVFMSREEGLSLSVKLPSSCHVALDLPFTEPTGYGLALAFGLWAQRLWLDRRVGSGQAMDLDAFEAELGSLRGELGEAQERMDFIERLLAREPERQRLDPKPPQD